MRTRKEQMADIEDFCGTLGISNDAPDAEIIEQWLAEAEQRVRDEIGKDSERLDWVANNQCQFENHGLGDRPLRVVNDCMGDKLASSYDLRAAIDAAREVG
ncbi:hypothetical protein [Acetobacter sp. DsW_059]|uniref:hypothetical protein n=1 Tax=Acetobacter sp. DsW_059 TaxID=1670661 RepID=UPI000A3D5528|nr:hypothetical protein [Acetobacter sp. DsW_059]OUJ10310.1 hypothetical protein HK25_06995 [Acetobacter sp. DsW_059]